MKFITLSLDQQSVIFQQIPVTFRSGDLGNIFAQKNNKTLEQTLMSKKYTHLLDVVKHRYSAALLSDLGEFLLTLKSSGDDFYKRFLNPYGDGIYCDFAIEGEQINQKGLYCFVIDNHIHYVGRCRDSFRKRINQGYGHISPKNCYLDGQSTNCHLNSLINSHKTQIELYVCPIVNDGQITQNERSLIQQLQPSWNIALKGK